MSFLSKEAYPDSYIKYIRSEDWFQALKKEYRKSFKKPVNETEEFKSLCSQVMKGVTEKDVSRRINGT